MGLMLYWEESGWCGVVLGGEWVGVVLALNVYGGFNFYNTQTKLMVGFSTNTNTPPTISF